MLVNFILTCQGQGNKLVIFIQTPTYISRMFTKNPEIHSRCSRSVDNDVVHVPFSRTTYFKCSFTGAKQWNSLPAELRCIININSFKHAVKSLFLHSDEPV